MNGTKNPKITIYSSPTCAFCHMAMHYLDGKNIKYKEVDVSQDINAAMWVQNKIGYVATPVIDIEGDIILGFDRPKIDKALQLA